MRTIWISQFTWKESKGKVSPQIGKHLQNLTEKRPFLYSLRCARSMPSAFLDEKPGLTKALTSKSDVSKGQRTPPPMPPPAWLFSVVTANWSISCQWTYTALHLCATWNSNFSLNNFGLPGNKKLQAPCTKFRSSGARKGRETASQIPQGLHTKATGRKFATPKSCLFGIRIILSSWLPRADTGEALKT